MRRDPSDISPLKTHTQSRGRLSTHRDVAAMQAELEYLRASERRYRYMIEHMAEGVGLVDTDERFIFCNPSAERLFGVAPGELAGRSLREFVTNENFTRLRKETELRRKGIESAYELRIISQSGVPRTLSVIAVPWLNAEQRVSGAFATFRDVTPQRTAEAALQRARDMAQQFLDVASVILVAIGPDRKVTMINRKGCEILGRSESDIIGTDWFDTYIPERMRQDVKHVFDQLMAGEIEPVEYFENPVLTASGEEKLIAWHNAHTFDASGRITGTLSSGEDITDRNVMEQETLRLERMRAMAEMTAGISHNLNNILGGVAAHCQLLQKAAGDGVVLREAQAIMKSAGRAEDLVRRLQWAVLGRDEEVGPVSLNEHVIEGVQEVRGYCRTERTGGGDIEILTSLEDVPPVRGTRSGVREVLVSVLLNAVDAMPHGGTIAVFTGEDPEGVQLIVKDDGAGMDEETRKRIFEPFFTTKAEVGTGLGLSTVYGALTRWGGTVGVLSNPGSGTTVTMHFRKTGPADGPAREHSPSADPSKTLNK